MSPAELKLIILYDIPSTTPGRPWSPNTMRTRYCLGYKQLPFTTVWVELPDIVRLFQSKGTTQPPYTLPAVEDLNTGAFIVDSLAIATYLDETYPETPKVLSPAAHTLLENVEDIFSFRSGGGELASASVSAKFVFLILAADRLNPVSKAYYYQTRAARLGEPWTTLGDACATGPEARAEKVRRGIEALREVWQAVTAVYEHKGDLELEGGAFVLGEAPCFFDFAVAGRIKFILDGLLPSEVETVTKLEGGRLMRLVETLEGYYKY